MFSSKTRLPAGDLIVNICRFKEICRPPSSVSSKFTSEASNASRSSSAAPEGLATRFEPVKGSIFHSRIVESCEPDARMRASSSLSEGLKARHLTQSSCPGRIAAEENYRVCSQRPVDHGVKLDLTFSSPDVHR